MEKSLEEFLEQAIKFVQVSYKNVLLAEHLQDYFSSYFKNFSQNPSSDSFDNISRVFPMIFFSRTKPEILAEIYTKVVPTSKLFLQGFLEKSPQKPLQCFFSMNYFRDFSRDSYKDPS